MSTSTDDISLILQQIETCLGLARQCNDDEIAGHLVALARAFANRAIERGADAALIPDLATNATARAATRTAPNTAKT
jgi:hypothetical protein